MSTYDDYPGIKEDQYGIRANVKVGQRQKGKRFKRGTPLKTITDWQDRTRVALRDDARPVAKGRLAADAAHYLTHQKVQLVTSSYASLVCEINAWLEPFGQVPRHPITREMVIERGTAGSPNPAAGRRRARARATPSRTPPRRATTGCGRSPASTTSWTAARRRPRATTCRSCASRRPIPSSSASPRSQRSLQRLTDPKTRARFMVLAVDWPAAGAAQTGDARRRRPGARRLAGAAGEGRPGRAGHPDATTWSPRSRRSRRPTPGATSTPATTPSASTPPAGRRASGRTTPSTPRDHPGRSRRRMGRHEGLVRPQGHQDDAHLCRAHSGSARRATAQHLEGRLGWKTGSPQPKDAQAHETGSQTGSLRRPNGTPISQKQAQFGTGQKWPGSQRFPGVNA